MPLPRRLQVKLERTLREREEIRNERLQLLVIVGFLIIGTAEIIARHWQ